MEKITISAPHINTEEALQYIKEALESGQIAQGAGVAKTEREVAGVFEAPHTALYANGTASLRGALVSGVAAKFSSPERVDRFLSEREVIIPAFSFNATLNTVLQTGATARMVDIKETDFGIDSDLAAEAINDRTVAIMPVDLYGQAASVDNGDKRFAPLAIIRDAAQAHGATINGQSLTMHGDAVSLSFYPTKNIAAPEGGAILTANEEIDRIARVYRNQGMSAPYVYDMIGDNLRMTDIHAAVLRANLGQLAAFNTQRSVNAAQLSEGLDGIEGLVLPRIQALRNHVWHQYTVRVEPEVFGVGRDELKTALEARGIGSGVYYPKTMASHPAFEGHPRIISEPTPIANKIAKQVLSLPVHPGLGEPEIERVINAIKQVKRSI